ncbi:MAG: hypothetical protein ABJC39_01145 [Chloroflexota bacterium]
MHDAPPEALDVADDGLEPARGPFTILGLHWIGGVFVLFALGDLAWFVVSADLGATPAPADLIVYGLQAFPALAAILFPVALLARHPDAVTRAPVLLLGTILFALVQLMLILANPLGPIFDSLTPASGDVPFDVLAEAYNALTLTVAALGLGLVARGLSLARRYEDRRTLVVDWFVPIAATVATVVGILAASRLSLGDGPLAPITIVYIVVNVILGIARVAVWTYLMTAAFRGVLASEEPRAGWRLGALAGAVVLVALVLVNLAGVLDVTDRAIIENYGWIVVISYALGHLLLLAGFAVGLPSLAAWDDDDEVDEVDEDNDDGFETEEAGYQGGPVYDNEFPEEPLSQARSVGSADARLRRKLTPSSTDSTGA